jgi:mono/diheme cytochrome c family protein
LLLLLTWGTVAGPKTAAIEYNRDVRPILSENCFACHGTDSASRKAGLRLDQPQIATNKLEDGAVAIVPGRPQQSELIRRIFADDDDHMPPAKVNKVLKPEQMELLKNWIAAGAKYEPHWSFIPPQKAPLPAVTTSQWVRNPIDQFILARLEQEKLKPNAEADKRTLIRRVTLDLTGLPPTPEQVSAFVKDRSPDAYEKIVDRLLASPEWGEQRAHYWLDAARYGDTHGIHFDNYREIWTYREWVINAFNQNLPFDEFTRENLAGDLLPDATPAQKIGSGFNRCNVTSNEGGAIDDEYYALYARDRTETTAQVWLGLTAGCAVCHDHKYDPLTQKEFYSLTSFFNNVAMKAMDGNIKDTPPVMVIPKPDDEKRWSQLAGEKKAAEDQIAQLKASARVQFTNWLARSDFTLLSTNAPTDAPAFHALLDDGSTNGANILIGGVQVNLPLATNVVWQDGAVAAQAFTTGKTPLPPLPQVGDYSRDEAFSYAVWVKLDGDMNGAVFARMEDTNGVFRGWDLWLEGGKPAIHILHSWPDNAIKVISRSALARGQWNHVCVTYDGSSKADGVRIYLNGGLQEVTVEKNSLTQNIRTPAPFKIGQRDTTSPVLDAGLQDLQIYARELKAGEAQALAVTPRVEWLARKPAPSTNDNEELFGLWLDHFDAPYREAGMAAAQLAKEEKEIRKRGTVAYVMQERTNAPEAFVLFRGQYDQPRERVTPATPAFLPPMPADAPRNRLGFAEWLLRPDNPLPARVTVNRFWQELFGTGLVKTSGDFGVAGEEPSNPKLLDWLAVDFREHNWDVKRIFKLLVMSATYRQSAAVTPEKLEKDPENRLLARGPRFRMDAEMIRDYALAASGLLVDRIGGPSVRPYQPPGIWDKVGMPEGDTRKYEQDHGDNLHRRSVYTFWKRQAAPASMEIFNAPSRETCTVRRERTDTPLQALVTLNDPQFVEAARCLAQQGLEHKTDALDFMAERLLARPLTAREKSIVQASAGKLLAQYRADPKAAAQLLAIGDSKPDAKLDPPTLAAYTMVANELMNLDEVLNK